MRTFACAISLLALAGAPLAAAELVPGPPPDFFADFAGTDGNHDGKLSWEEFLMGRESREGKPGSGVDGTPLNYKWISHYVERFSAMDVNKDESLTLEEYVKGRLLNTFNDGRLRFICSDDKAVYICR